MKAQKKEMIAMILAGGQGTRLKSITANIAKPAVTFAGKYRIIDFALSNCSNSDIDTVGILTQYEPLVLSNHIGIGNSWDLEGGVKILPPYKRKDGGGQFYKGTANAIYENIPFIEDYDPEYVLILSGDHIYNMDYEKMLKFHKKENADVTISVLEVPWEEASRFGILAIDDNKNVVEFQEKPKNPKSNLASMGIYIFNWKLLREKLIEDDLDINSVNDFGKNIMPKLVSEDCIFSAYEFEGYWKDVGTVESLWEANMDLLKGNQEFDLYDKRWRNYSVNPNSPPQYISQTGIVENSLLNEGCIIEGAVKHSVISPDVKVGENAIVEDSIIMHGAVVEPGARVYKTIVLENSIIKEDEMIGNLDSENVGVCEGYNGGVINE